MKNRTRTKKPAIDKPEAAGELRRDAEEVALLEGRWKILGDATPPTIRPKQYQYVGELVRLQFELLKMQEWVRLQWYFQRYVAHLPTAGEIVLFDRSWYNRAGVERVMGFCSDDEYQEFLRSCPLFEDMLVRSNIYLVKYWFSVSDEEQERRFSERMRNPIKRWKLSPMDLEARKHWVEYSKAKDVMLEYTDRKKAPWFIIDADNKKRARLNCIAHLLTQVPYKDLHPIELELPPRQEDTGYKRPKKSSQRWVTRMY